MVGVVQYYGTGRRKRAIARVFLRPGSGKLLVNGRPLEEYFERDILRMVIKQPLNITETVNRFDAYITVKGGGKTGQAEAIRSGIARALLEYNSEFRQKLKPAGLLRRDPRKKERKKYGKPKARKSFQFSKR